MKTSSAQRDQTLRHQRSQTQRSAIGSRATASYPPAYGVGFIDGSLSSAPRGSTQSTVIQRVHFPPMGRFAVSPAPVPSQQRPPARRGTEAFNVDVQKQLEANLLRRPHVTRGSYIPPGLGSDDSRRGRVVQADAELEAIRQSIISDANLTREKIDEIDQLLGNRQLGQDERNQLKNAQRKQVEHLITIAKYAEMIDLGSRGVTSRVTRDGALTESYVERLKQMESQESAVGQLAPIAKAIFSVLMEIISA